MAEKCRGPHLQHVAHVCGADVGVLRGVEGDRSDPHEGQDPGLRVPPHHDPRAVVRLAVEHHLMGTRQLLRGCG